MAAAARRIREAFQSRILRSVALAVVLPALLVAPGQAGMVLLHRHCDDSSSHFHRSHHTDLDAWRESHADHHPGEGPGHTEPWESGAAVDGDCDRNAPILVLPLSSEKQTRPLRSSSSITLNPSLAARAVAAVWSSSLGDPPRGGPPPPDIWRADLSALDAVAVILQRNHALLL